MSREVHRPVRGSPNSATPAIAAQNDERRHQDRRAGTADEEITDRRRRRQRRPTSGRTGPTANAAASAIASRFLFTRRPLPDRRRNDARAAGGPIRSRPAARIRASRSSSPSSSVIVCAARGLHGAKASASPSSAVVACGTYSRRRRARRPANRRRQPARSPSQRAPAPTAMRTAAFRARRATRPPRALPARARNGETSSPVSRSFQPSSESASEASGGELRSDRE